MDILESTEARGLAGLSEDRNFSYAGGITFLVVVLAFTSGSGAEFRRECYSAKLIVFLLLAAWSGLGLGYREGCVANYFSALPPTGVPFD